jgi:hypothetical protein
VYKYECTDELDNLYSKTDEVSLKTIQNIKDNYTNEAIIHSYHKEVSCDVNTFENSLIKLEAKINDNTNNITKEISINADDDMIDESLINSATMLDFDFTKRKRKYLNAKGFSIESLIGRVLEER